MQRSRRFGLLGFVAAFAAVHAFLWWLSFVVPNLPIGDVEITYRRWIETGLTQHVWVGTDTDWVYPILAIVPMALAAVVGTAHIGAGWLGLMVVLDAVACAFLWRFRAFGVRVVWWWLGFLLALGPIGLGRIDTVATAVALVGVAFVAARPAVASAVFTVAAWVKVWPAALVGVLLVLRRGRRRGVLAGAVVVTALVVLVDVLFGGAAHLLSFIGQQSGRALQIESPLATPFMWAAAAHVPGAAVYYDREILTFEVSGSGTHLAAAVSTPLMAAVVLGGLALAAWGVGRGARRVEVAPVLALVLVAALIATNKVGSPQYVGWFAVPVVWGLVAGRTSARRFLPVAVAAVPMALLTQVIYPAYYDQVLTVQPWILMVLTLRNALEVALLVWALVVLVRLGLAARRAGDASSSGRSGAALGRTGADPGRAEPPRGRMDA
ncbi:glycosyltransferase 87 family protein [Curtobacterium sp. MCBA15_001]|uniref:glycosyltransferase 87 family protein n=1 Tax=Curtobacterium sp. MCBA15_001 TaxID=1898731 RepID=UPI0015877778|nr:glycosyltransferase 87 family protein [Curtobacterium sp. MCBA15_001]